ncbi:MAG: hypothetical protein EBZ52_08530, partial [Actinobacteria bacterium]|nr:hypothetical protein [Actinomycetota bacterium]
MADDVSRLWLHVLADSERTGNALLSDLFEQDKARVVNMTKTLSDGDSEIVVDFSKQLVDQPALKNLLQLAKTARVVEKFVEMCGGAKINF